MPHSLPNILLVFTDQQRYDSIAALGNPIIRTPTFDRLAREGTVFERCYTPSPVCVSARCSLVTGLQPHRTGVFDNTAMPQNLPSFMERLRERGYQTHGVGKMHFTPDPRRMWGFESRDLSEEGMEDDDFKESLRAAGFGHVEDANGVRGEYYYIPQVSQLPAHLHNSHWVADRSIDFLRRRDKTRPFFLWASFIKPHPPFEVPTPWNKLYRGAEMLPPFRPEGCENLLTFWNRVQNRYKYRDAGQDDHLLRTMRAAYYAQVSFLDYNLGRILAALGEDIHHTLIVVTSDHGELLGDYGSFGKRCMLDAAARVPLIARWPGHFTSGGRTAAPASLIDLWPTFLSAAGYACSRADPEGATLMAVAGGRFAHRYVFSQFSQKRTGLYLITDGRWKYSYSAADRKEWLFDLHLDPRESHNLAYNPAYRRKTVELREELIARFERDGYADAVEHGGWRVYPTPDLPDDPDYGLLYQDAPLTQQHIDELGVYARPVTLPPEYAAEMLFRVTGQNEREERPSQVDAGE